MRSKPAASFTLVVLISAAVATAVTVLLLRHGKAGPESEEVPLPSDLATFGFEVKERLGEVALLEASRTFQLDLANGPVQGLPPTAAHVASARSALSRELARYPSTFLHRIHLAGVVLTDDLRENAHPIPSLPNVGGLLLLDAHAPEGDLPRTIHHEIFHFFDLADDGKLAPDPAWEALNAPRFVYGSGGRSMRGAFAGKPANELPGFITAYATSGVEEDKAETFAFLVTETSYLRLRASSDLVLAAKSVELVRRIDAMTPGTSKALGL